MPIVEHRAVLSCKQATAFHTSQDYALRQQWGPFAAKLESESTTNGRRIITVTAWHGLTMVVEYVAWLPPERAAIRMLKGPRVLASFAGTWAFVETGEQQVTANFRYQIKAARGWGWLEPLMLRYFSWETKRRLHALQRYLEHTCEC
ncbi:SRPBCC family protein [Chitinimonas sp. JJ19]|uniref:SRPBCC family protein n=1 Tax=Chitinimonas sp. JJ19 TaxID=3109352 RepID=UPI003001F7E0